MSWQVPVTSVKIYRYILRIVPLLWEAVGWLCTEHRWSTAFLFIHKRSNVINTPVNEDVNEENMLAKRKVLDTVLKRYISQKKKKKSLNTFPVKFLKIFLDRRTQPGMVRRNGKAQQLFGTDLAWSRHRGLGVGPKMNTDAWGCVVLGEMRSCCNGISASLLSYLTKVSQGYESTRVTYFTTVNYPDLSQETRF